jgi:uncharacterized protein (DUF2235 family)
MALYAFDGTGNEDRDGDDRDSNVLGFFRGYDDPMKNDDPDEDRGSLYLKGIGRRARTILGTSVAEAFGIGGHRRVGDAIDRLQNNLRAGDDVVDVIGFSRGAALAVSFANEVARKLPDVSIRFLGLWDVVGQFGAPGRFVNAGHILTMPHNAKACFHAMAMDESRALFPLTRMCKHDGSHDKTLTEVWFRGVHSDVGGGNANRGMNWISLNFLFESARRTGLPIDPARVAANLADKSLPQEISDHKADLGVLRTFFRNDRLHSSVQLTPGVAGRPHNNPAFALERLDDAGNVLSVV